jgi:hypothetical protein
MIDPGGYLAPGAAKKHGVTRGAAVEHINRDTNLGGDDAVD